ncbi:MAG: FkbM family methyltransferase [Candidatus Paceibacterota bacterium]
MKSDTKTSTIGMATDKSVLWRFFYRLYHRLRWLPAQLRAVWRNQPTVEITNRMGRFTALPLTGTIRETDPTYRARLQSWVTDAPGGIFIDVGAGSGFFSRLATTRGAATRSFAFESNPAVYALLLKNIADNDLNAEGFNLAISREAGKMNLAPHSVNTGHTSSCSGRSGVMVASRPLDEFMQIRDIEAKNIGCLRIESEGYELGALAGMRRTLDEMRPGARLIIRLYNNAEASESTLVLLKWSGFRQIDKSGEHHLFEKTHATTGELLENSAN